MTVMIPLFELLRDWTAFAFWQSFLFLGMTIVLEHFLRRSPWQAHLLLTLGIFVSVLGPVVSLLVFRYGDGVISSGSIWALEKQATGPASVLGPMIFVGAPLFLLFFLYGIVSARRLMFHARPFPDRESQEALLEGSRLMRNVSLPILFTSPSVKSPTVWSWGLHPAVLLPEKLSETLSPEERDGIFLHELAHIIRRDHWTAFFVRFCGIFLFWNPLYWLALKLSDLAADRACDLLVLSRERISPEIYGETLLRLAVGEKNRPVFQYLSRKEQLMKRIGTILDYSDNRKAFSVTRSPVRIFGMLLSVLFLTAALAFCQEKKTEETETPTGSTAKTEKEKDEKPSYEKTADDLVARFAKGDFSETGFTQTMKDGKAADIAKALWDDFQKQFGPFVESKAVKTETLLEFKRVHERCEFENGTVVLMVVVDKNDQVAGLFVMSSEKKELPPYIDSRINSPIWLLEQEAQDRPPHIEVWNGNANMMTMLLAMRSGGRKWLELSDTQQKTLRYLGKPQEIGVEWFQKMHQEQNAELIEAEEAAQALVPKDDPLFEKATTEQKRAYVEACSKPMILFYRHVQKEVAETLTPEQLAKLRSLEFAVLPRMGEPTPYMFDSLGISEEQQKKVEVIKKESEPEFLKLLDEQMKLRNEHLVLYTQGKNSETDRKDYGVRYKEQESRRVEFSMRLKERLVNDVLTEEQRIRAEKLAEDIPGSLKRFFAETKTEKVRSYRVDKKVSEFPEDQLDLSTPEAAYALSNRIIAGDEPDRITSLQQYTVNRSIPDNLKKWVESMSAEDRKMVGDAMILKVFVYKDKSAMVVAEVEKNKRYNTRMLTNEYGRWFNIGGGGFFNGKSDDDVVNMCDNLFQREVKRWDAEKPEKVWKTPDQVGYTHLVVFEPAEPFEPKTDKELLDALNERLFKRNDILTGYFRTETNEKGKLVGRICTTNPTRLREVIESTPDLKLEKIWLLDKKIFEEHTGKTVVESAAESGSVPKIMKMEPENDAKDVDPASVTELRVTFDRDMDMGGFSWCGGPPLFPETTDKPRWIDKRTCVLPVKLVSGKTYQLSINAASFKNFRSADGVPVEPVPYSFTTKE